MYFSNSTLSLNQEALMSQLSHDLLMLEFLSWISSRRRTYAEAMNAWQSSCPRLTIWEDAMIDGYIEVNRQERSAIRRSRLRRAAARYSTATLAILLSAARFTDHIALARTVSSAAPP